MKNNLLNDLEIHLSKLKKYKINDETRAILQNIEMDGHNVKSLNINGVSIYKNENQETIATLGKSDYKCEYNLSTQTYKKRRNQNN